MFAGICFALEPGEVLLLHGPNGSGKSSLLRIMAGFLRPAAGRILWQGASIEADPAGHRRQLCYLGHADAVKGVLTVRENLAFAVALNKLAGDRSDDERIDGALERFDLAALATTPARYLSAGQRRRLALARLLTGWRSLWLLDEPGVGVDAANRARLQEIIAEHRHLGGMVVLATHGDTTVTDAKMLDLGASAVAADP